MSSAEKITYFGETDYRNKRTKFGIKQDDRSRHVYIIGKTGMGKSTMLENMAAQDILNGEGMCFMDPHGSAIDVLLDYIPPHRIQDVVYFAPFDTDYPMSFNVFESVDPEKRHLVVSGLMASFKKIWPDAFSARMEYILANTLLALLEYPGATLLGVNRMLAEKEYRDEIISHITDDSVKSFWIDEYNKWDVRYAREAGAAIQNKIGQFTGNPLIRNIVGQEISNIDFRKIMDEKKILLVNLSKGLIGESNGNLLGGMLITKLYLAAMSRADVGAGNLKNLPNFFFFVDEFQNFANESFADILSEARKYKLNLTVAHQYIEQMEEEVAAAIFGNVGTMVTFRVGPTDAEFFEKQFTPTFTVEDIVNLGKYQIYLSLMIDGIGSRPFSARTLPPIPQPEISSRDQVIESSRRKYAQPRALVEEKIKKWFEPVKKPEKRSFKNQTPQKKQASSDNSLSTKKVFVAYNKEQDFNLSDPKKSLNEKEVEVEMKDIVSPKLSNLLDKISSSEKNSQKNISLHQSDNISPSRKKTKTEETRQELTIKNQKNNKERAAAPTTTSSLQQVLQKALAGYPQQKSSSIVDSSENIKKQAPPLTESPKEVPEDILKNILHSSK